MMHIQVARTARLFQVFPRASLSTAQTDVKVYGHYVSQPARSVMWLLKLNSQPFDFVKIDVFKGEARSPAYKAKFPTQLIPGMDDNGFYLAEGSPIMIYLAEKYGWDKWWPSGNDASSMQQRAKISEYLSSHHHTTRLLSHNIVRPLFMGKMPSPEEKVEKVKASEKIIDRFAKAFLKDCKFVNGLSHPSIADLAAYSEIGQLVHLGILQEFSNPLVKEWADRMSNLPSHDDVHSSNFKLGKMLKDKAN